jgi:beta-glucosidase
MNTPREAPGRTSGRAPAHNGQAHRDLDLLAALSLDDKVSLLTGADNWRTRPLPAIGLRGMVVSDGPAGVRGITMDERNPSASLPCPSALGATWDPALVQTLAAALGTEARSKGVDVLLAPTINVMRTPVGGRGFESFGEDPVLIARLAVAFVCGLHQAGAAAAVKHYVANDSETGRWTYDARIAEYVLRELYLAPFEACVREADVDLVMTGYNKVNGVTMTEHGSLLTRILKDEWGFAGVALSDWHAARSTMATAVAGLDLAMPGPGGPWGGKLVAAVRAGQISEDAVDAKVLRILRLARRVGALGAPQAPNGGTALNGQAPHESTLNGQAPHETALNGQALHEGTLNGRDPDEGALNDQAPVLADPALLRRCAAAAFTLLRNDREALPIDPRTIRSVAVIGPNAVSPVTQGGGSATVPQVSVSTPAGALTEALTGLARVTVRPGCVTWTSVPEPPRHTLRDPDTGEPGVRIEFRTEDGALAAAEHRAATMFTWWDGLPEGIGWGGRGTIELRTRYRPAHDGPHVIGAGGVGLLRLTVNGIEVAAGHTDVPADPVEAMVRPGEIRTTVYLAAAREAEIGISLQPDDWPQGPVAIRLGVGPAPDDDTMLSEAVEAARAADAAVVVVGSGPATESEGFDRPGLFLPGRQDELVRRVAAVNDRTIVVVNAGMPTLMPWADQVAAIGYAWLPGQAMGAALADVLLGQAEPGGRLPVTIPAAEADCPVLHSVPDQGRLEYQEGLLIGYRGYDRAGTKPHFPFGHGLGYTTWAYESATADAPVVAPDGDLGVTVVLRNTGRRTGREVVQAYLEPPTADPGRPVRALAAFAAVTAAPGEHAEARLTVPARAFDRYDEEAGTSGGWVRPSGEFTVRIGRSSADLPLHLRVKSL